MNIKIEKNNIDQEAIIPYTKPDIMKDLEILKTGFKETIMNHKLKEIFLFNIDATSKVKV